MLQLAEILIKGAEEAAPKVTIHIPITPVLETPPALSALQSPIVAPVKSRRPTLNLGKPPRLNPLKTPSAAPDVSPTTPSVAMPKIKLAPRQAPVDDAILMPPPEVPPPAPKPARPPPQPRAPLIKKGKVAKEQTTGMGIADVKACRNALQRLNANKHSLVFRQPVDPIRDNAPKYVTKSCSIK